MPRHCRSSSASARDRGLATLFVGALLASLACRGPARADADTTAATDTAADTAADGALPRLRREGAIRLARRAAWITGARPCAPPTLVDTAGWRPPLLPSGHEARGVVLPPDFTPDPTAEFFPHAGAQWRAPGGRTFMRARWFWGPDDADTATACRLAEGKRPYVVALRRDSAGVALTAFEADPAWAESDGVVAASPQEADLPLLWSMVRAAVR